MAVTDFGIYWWSFLRQEPEAPDKNATSREVLRISPPDWSQRFQVAGLNQLISVDFSIGQLMSQET
jgi:hypothetical protein